MAMTRTWPHIAAFTYHEVTDDPSSSGFQRLGAMPYKLTPRAFAAHLARIAAGPVAPTRVTGIDFTRPGHFVLLTFDDGGKSALYAGEELCRRGWTGHFFVVSSLMGRRTFMTAGDIRHLVSCGHLVGTHSHTGELAQFRGWTRALMLRRLKALARAGLPLLYRHYVRRTTREQPGGA